MFCPVVFVGVSSKSVQHTSSFEAEMGRRIPKRHRHTLLARSALARACFGPRGADEEPTETVLAVEDLQQTAGGKDSLVFSNEAAGGKKSALGPVGTPARPSAIHGLSGIRKLLHRRAAMCHARRMLAV